ncbi:disintegrin and metalloproteinase domain-containing protein 19 [Pleurodeles waltl]|uniref:disintegrin and metalloproteinase domain-containing protein 19 n=1 Tax=Pleurodeles waltl TaxID=8319 RepID=UPI0037098077
MADTRRRVGAFVAWLGLPMECSLLRISLTSFSGGLPLVEAQNPPRPRERVLSPLLHLPLLLVFLAITVPPVVSGHRGETFEVARVLNHQGKYPHEVTTPSWLGSAASGRGEREKFPSAARLKVTVEGKELILELKKNKQLLAPNYTETYYSRSGNPIVRPANLTEHCYYHGTVLGWKHSHVVLSACSGFRGLISLSSNLSYLIEPLPGDRGLHIIYRAEHFKIHGGTCGHQHPQAVPDDWTSGITSVASSGHHRVRRDNLDNWKYVELYLVADHAEFQKHQYDLESTKQKMIEVANYIDKFYKWLNIRVALVGLEVWTDGNKCNVTENPYSTLWSFLAWRRKLLSIKKHDNAQLITGHAFQGTTIGLAPLLAMCSVYQSGGVNMDHSDNSIGIASTMAHEMGHNFGMSHDSSGCCTASAAEGGCIMAAATGHPFPRVFNKCNRKQLDRYLQTGGGMCLSNRPDTSTMYGGSRCGNGYLEDGEECDCGEEEECTNPCCIASNCTLILGAECAHGICCQQCRLRPPGTMCRKESRPCDLPEYCTGKSAFCPPNSYQLDGTACQEGRAYCYSGMCLTHQHQCTQLWGPGARPAPDICFQKVNAAGDTYGNCGKDVNGRYRMCASIDARCGKIQCQSSASKPLDANAVAIDTTVTLEGKRIRCRGTHVYRTVDEDVDNLDQSDILDPGLVMTGTKCGDNHVCFEGQCRNVDFFQTEECATKCHRHGICNNNRNCHCSQGWDPPFCNRTGSGGSIDSGPPPLDGSGAVVFGALTLALLLILLPGTAFCLYIYKRKDKIKMTCAPQPDAEQSQTRHHLNPEPRKGTGHANPTYRLCPPLEESKESDCRGGSSARFTVLRPTTKNVQQPTAASTSNTHTPEDLPQRDAAGPTCETPGAANVTDIARKPTLNLEIVLKTNTVSCSPLTSGALHQTDTVRQPSLTPGALNKADTVRESTPLTEAFHQTDSERQETFGFGDSHQTDNVRHPSPVSGDLPHHLAVAHTHTPAALPKIDASKSGYQSLGELQQVASVKHSLLSRGAFHQTQPIKQPSRNLGTPLQAQAVTSERDSFRPVSVNPGALHQKDLMRRSPPKKPAPPVPPHPPIKKYPRSDPPQKPLPAVPVIRPKMVVPRTQHTSPTTGRKKGVMKQSTAP